MTASASLRAQDINCRGSLIRETAVQLLCLLLVVAIGLLSLGPLVDHHFAERHPGHQHFYLGSADPAHSHGYEDSHGHRSSWVYGAAVPSDAGREPYGIVFLMPNDGAGHGAADIAVPVALQSVRFGSAAGNLPPGGADDVETALSGASVTPSAPPPRA